MVACRLENEHVNNVVGKFDAERQPHSIEGDINKDFVKDLEGAEV